MLDAILSDLTNTYGPNAATSLSTAYESAILTISLGRWDRIPDRATRLTIVEAMLAYAHRNGFDTARLTEAAVSAAAR